MVINHNRAIQASKDTIFKVHVGKSGGNGGKGGETNKRRTKGGFMKTNTSVEDKEKVFAEFLDYCEKNEVEFCILRVISRSGTQERTEPVPASEIKEYFFYDNLILDLDSTFTFENGVLQMTQTDFMGSIDVKQAICIL